MSQINFLFDSQILDAISECDYKFHYQFERNLVGLKPNRKIVMGGFLHDIYERYNRALMDRRSHSEARILALRDVEAIFPEGLDPIDCHTVIRAFEESSDHYSHEIYTVKSVEAAGAKLLYETPEIRIAYVTKIDVKIDGQNFTDTPIDYKSEHRKSDPSKLRNQFKGYAWFTGSNRIFVRKIGFQTSLKPADKFRTYPFFYTESELEEWRIEAVRWALRVIDVATGKEDKKHNATSCDIYSGCFFKHICEASPENREGVIEHLYRVNNPWDPFKAKDGEE